MTLGEVLPLVAIAAAFWFLIIRPANVRRREQARLAASLGPGQGVMTTAGVFGTITAIDGDRVSVEIAPGVVIRMLTQAIAQTVTEHTPAVEPVEEARTSTEQDDAGLPHDVDGPSGLGKEADRG